MTLENSRKKNIFFRYSNYLDNAPATEKIIFFIIFLAFILLCWLAVYVGLKGDLNIEGTLNYKALEPLGTFIGGVIGTLLTVVTIILVWLTYNSQKKELKETKEMISEQNFQTMYFNLLALLNESSSQLKFKHVKGGQQFSPQGNAAFEIVNKSYIEYNLTTYRKNLTSFSLFVKTFTTLLRQINNKYNFIKRPSLESYLEIENPYLDIIQSQLSYQAKLFLYNYYKNNIADSKDQKLYESSGLFDESPSIS